MCGHLLRRVQQGEAAEQDAGLDEDPDFEAVYSAARMVLSPSPASRTFYARLGFQPAAELDILQF